MDEGYVDMWMTRVMHQNFINDVDIGLCMKNPFFMETYLI